MIDRGAAWRPRPAPAAALLLLLTLLVAGLPASVSAQVDDDQVEGTQPAATVELQLTRVEGVVDEPTDEVVVAAQMRDAGDSGVTDVRVELSAHAPVASRSALQNVLDAPPQAQGERLGRSTGSVAQVAADLPRGGRRFVAVRASLQDLGVDAGTPKVVPLSLSLSGVPAGGSGSSELARAVTALIVVPPEVDRPVAAALVVRLLGLDPATGREAEDVTWVPPVAQAIAAAGVPVGVAADPLLARTIAGPAVSELLAGDDVARLGVPFASADLPALVGAEMANRARSHVALGVAPWPADPAGLESRLRADRPEEPVVATAGAVDAATAQQLLAGRAAALVVGPDAVGLDADLERPTSPGPVRPLADVEGLDALVGDPWLGRTLGQRPELDGADVQRVLAETALLWLERPGASLQRGVLLDPGAQWRPRPDGLAELLRALADAPWLQLTIPAELLSVEPSPQARLLPPSEEAGLSLEYLAALDEAWSLVEAATGILSPPTTESGGESADPGSASDADPGIEVTADGVTAGLRLDLLRAASVAFRDDEAAGRELITRAATSAAQLVEGVEVLGQPTIALTDEAGRLPVVLRNDAASPLRVRVDLRSSRLVFPSGAQQVTLAPLTTTTVVFEARARTPGGTSPVDVTVTDPSGDQALATGTMVVRIASYPVSALVVLGVVALVLLGSWLRGRFRHRRTDRPPAPLHADAPERESSAADAR